MAECSFSRCVQERRIIKKELQRWTKNMVVVVGLERVAEELMGRRKWKQCQNALSACDAAASADAATGTSLFESSIADASEETKDWTPPEKCNLCNEKSLLLDRAPSPGSELDSSSNDSVYRESPPPAFHPRTPPAMTAYESVKLAAIAALSHSPDGGVMSPNMFYPPSHHGGLFTPWYLPPHLSARASTPHALEVPVQQPMVVKEDVAVGAEMPLDLSAKAVDSQAVGGVPQSLRVPSMDSKQIYKAKPRMSAVAGRRTYTEDELQAALRDIQSGKLGTRRAAVIYGIPRSTLRNKVYKLAMERERDAQLLLSAPTPPPASLLKRGVGVGDDDDKELSGAEEEREVEKALRKPLLSMEDLVRFSMLESNGLANPEAIRTLLTQSKMEGRFPFPPGDAWGGLEHSALGPYISQLLAAGKAQETEGSDFVPKFSPPLLPELVRRMMAEEKMLMESHAKRNGSVEREPRPSSSANRAAATAAASVGDDDNSDTDATPSNVILKIPSFKPTSSSSKNGTTSEPFPSPTQESSSQPGYNGADSRSPPSMIGKGIGVSLRDVIAKSISQKFQQGGEMAPMPLSQKLLLSPDAESPFKRGRYSPPMSHLQAHHAAIKHNNNNHHLDHDRNVQKMSPTGKSSMLSQTHAAAGGGGGGGKGTRPKRGKYRNYDRDSLVEAVRAVQRGEMSVHRAGSYYGVPHSTLEYKVKERHLMRPRKRDPKPPLDEPKRKDDLRLGSPQDKPGVGVGPKLLKPPFPTSPLQNPANGLKIPPMFDPAMSPLAYSTPPPFPFWQPSPFHGMPIPEFPRGPNAHEHFIASHMMQRLQEGSRLPGHPAHAMLNAQPPEQPQLGTNVRKIAESLYDGTGTNGNFLDGIIRSSLEMGLPTAGKEGGVSERAPENLSNKALLDQLCRNSRITPLPVHDGSTSEDESGKRSSVDGKDDTDRRMDFSPSSDDSARKDRDRHMDDDFDTKSGKDRFSEQGSPVSKDSRDEFSDNDARMEEESACDSKDNVQRSAVEETPAKEKGREDSENRKAVDEVADDDADEARSQSTETKTNIDLKSD